MRAIWAALIGIWCLNGAWADAIRLGDLEPADIEVELAVGPYNRRTGEQILRATLVNRSQAPESAPLYLAIEDLTPAGLQVSNAAGTSSEGIPYLEVTTPLAVGASTRLEIRLLNRRRVRFDFTPKVYRGAPNALPLADAGRDLHVPTGERVRLDGSASYDPDGDPLSFRWANLSSVPGSAAGLDDPHRPDPGFVPDLAGDYVFELVVNDGRADSAPARVRITAADAVAAPNADAGRDREVPVGAPVRLDGTGSSDPNGLPLDYLWSLVAVPAGSARTDADLHDRTTAQPQFSPDVEGAYRIRLRVDNGSMTDDDEVVVTARLANVAPMADAGPDRITRPGLEVQVDGRASEDPDGGPQPLRYHWRVVSSPAGSALSDADLGDADSAQARWTPDVEGTYVLRLTVSDGAAQSGDNVLVIADATPPQVAILHPADGSRIDTATPEIRASFQDGFGTGVDPATARLWVNGLDVSASSRIDLGGIRYRPRQPLPAGDNEVVVRVADRAGNPAQARSRFTVAVFRAIADCAPLSGEVPLQVRFRSRGEFTGGSLVRYRWDFDGDGRFDVSSAVAADYTRTFRRPGTYEAVLEVTNQLGETATDSCRIEAGGNPPTATASAAPSNGPVPLEVHFSCRASDRDGRVVLYEWDFDGDGVYDYRSADSGSVVHTYDQVGEYIARCRVTDDEGLTATARTIDTQVRPAPPGSPSVTAHASPTRGNAPLRVSFDGSAVDDGHIVLWEWDFDGDGVYDYRSAAGPATSHTYQEGGYFAATLRATDDEGKIGIDTVEVAVSLSASLRILDNTLIATPPQSPPAMANILTTLSGRVPMALWIQDGQGRVVRHLVEETRGAGTYTDSWDGRDDDGRMLPQGVYYAVLEYRLSGERHRLDLSHTTGGARSNPPRTGIPGSFSPFAGDPLDIDFRLDRAYEVTAFIGRFNVDTRLVTFFERVPFGKGSHRITWNGENAEGVLIHPPSGDRFLFGIFRYALPDNAIFLQSGVTVEHLQVRPFILDPAGILPVASVTFDLNGPADVELTVHDADTGALVRRRVFTGLPAGANILHWDGRGDDGHYAAAGRYRIGVAAIDASGYRSIRRYAVEQLYY